MEFRTFIYMLLIFFVGLGGGIGFTWLLVKPPVQDGLAKREKDPHKKNAANGKSTKQLRGDLSPEFKTAGRTFELWDMKVIFENDYAAFEDLPETQIHDAYDADRNQVWIRLSATFIKEGEGSEQTVPGFAMRYRPEGKWHWHVRWSPQQPGNYQVHVNLEGQMGPGTKKISHRKSLNLPVKITAGDASGHLVAPGPGDAPQYLRQLNNAGGSDAIWLFGNSRPWVVKTDEKDSWNEYINRQTELFPNLRGGGFNMLNQWMAPWEYLLVHHDRAEYWRAADDSWTRHEFKRDSDWSAYQVFDQGRAEAFDRLLQQCEGSQGNETIYLMLAPIPHHSLLMKKHEWGEQVSGWSPWDDQGQQPLSHFLGFSDFKRGLSAWDFFKADPGLELADWRSQYFDHQANYYRYLIARWAYSRALGIWVIMDEVDGIGDKKGSYAERTGWWEHPECDQWLMNMVQLFDGRLERSDGLKYMGDPYRHPLHVASTSSGGQYKEGANLEWADPVEAGIDIMGWHWYPYFWKENTNWDDTWLYNIDGIRRYAEVPLNSPRIISEFGARDRMQSSDEPSKLFPTLYHHAIWASIFSGMAGTPMDWDDGKEFGELRWRQTQGIFSRGKYHIDHMKEMQILTQFLKGLKPDDFLSLNDKAATVNFKPVDQSPGLRLFALYDKRDQSRMYGWFFTTDSSASFQVNGLQPGTYTLTWVNPWTGENVGDATEVTVNKDGVTRINAANALGILRQDAASFPEQSHKDLGKDLAFRLLLKK